MITNQSTLTRTGALRWLQKIEEASPAFTACFCAGTGQGVVESILLEVLDRGLLLDEVAAKAAKSPTGAVVYYIKGRAYVACPPFPLRETSLERGYNPGPMKAVLEHNWRVGIVLVHLGQYAIGICEGEKTIEVMAGTGLVHARHHKGGSSAQRFARHREKQMEYFFTRVEGHAREILEPQLKTLDYVLYGGVRYTLLTMWKQCDFFRNLESKTVDRLLQVREPKRSSFEEAVKLAYTSTLFEIAE